MRRPAGEPGTDPLRGIGRAGRVEFEPDPINYRSGFPPAKRTRRRGGSARHGRGRPDSRARPQTLSPSSASGRSRFRPGPCRSADHRRKSAWVTAGTRALECPRDRRPPNTVRWHTAARRRPGSHNAPGRVRVACAEGAAAHAPRPARTSFSACSSKALSARRTSWPGSGYLSTRRSSANTPNYSSRPHRRPCQVNTTIVCVPQNPFSSTFSGCARSAGNAARKRARQTTVEMKQPWRTCWASG